MELQNVVIVGASLAGVRAAETLRAEGYEARITLIGAEEHLPYDRPPLSKKVLTGDTAPEQIGLRSSDEIAALNLDLALGVRATELDTDNREVWTTSGRHRFDSLIIATGATPRRLPHSVDVDGTLQLRTLDDALALRSKLSADSTLTVIGAGFIGLEVAAGARALGGRVVVVEAAESPLVRALGPELGDRVARFHTRAGIELRCGTSLERISRVETGSGDHFTVALADGTSIESDAVLVAIGVVPATGWLDSSNVKVDDGVLCDETLQTSVPGIFAAGDCVRWSNPWLSAGDASVMRAEHWTSAIEQGDVAAKNVLAAARGQELVANRSVPYMWSDQGAARIQMLGQPHGDDEIHLAFEDPETGAFTALYGYGGKLRAVLTVNKPRLLNQLRPLLTANGTWEDALAKVGA